MYVCIFYWTKFAVVMILHLSFRGAKKKPYLTAQQFCDFLNKQQRDPRLNEILYPNYTLAQAETIIHRYENKSGMAQKGKHATQRFLSLSSIMLIEI